MFDLHSHILPGIDDGADTLETALSMARLWVDQQISVVACTPHILPGVYNNTGPQIREQIAILQSHLDANAIPLRLVTGADNHIVPSFVQDLQRGHLLTLNDTRYALVEPPHNTYPAQLEDLFHAIQVNGYVPILTHPERLLWAYEHYGVIARLADRGVLMQLTASSILGRFGRRTRDFALKMLEERRVHIVATDAHNTQTRPPDLLAAFRTLCEWVGEVEARNLCSARPRAILENVAQSGLPEIEVHWKKIDEERGSDDRDGFASGGFARRMWERLTK
jgi:protein-tyrosine phosphatase